AGGASRPVLDAKSATLHLLGVDATGRRRARHVRLLCRPQRAEQLAAARRSSHAAQLTMAGVAPLWRPADDYFPLADGDVDVWLIDLACTPSLSHSVLTARERARARRYRFSRDRDSFVRGRLALRAILAK